MPCLDKLSLAHVTGSGGGQALIAAAVTAFVLASYS